MNRKRGKRLKRGWKSSWRGIPWACAMVGMKRLRQHGLDAQTQYGFRRFAKRSWCRVLRRFARGMRSAVKHVLKHAFKHAFKQIVCVERRFKHICIDAHRRAHFLKNEPAWFKA